MEVRAELTATVGKVVVEKGATVTEGDGLRLDWDDRWVQVRGSNTEPIVRVISEAPDAVVAHRLCDAVVERVQEVV